MVRKKVAELEEEEPTTESPVESDKISGEIGLEDIQYSESGESTTHKLSPLRRKQLNTIGIEDVMELAVANPEDIMNACGIARDIASAYISAALAALEASGAVRKTVTSAADELERRLKLKYLTTGSAKFDDLLKGGIESGSVTEIYGPFGAGKTQICHTLAVNAQLPLEKKGLNGSVCWIDSELTFRPERIRDIALGNELDDNQILHGIWLERVRNAAHLELFVREELSKTIKEKNIKLIVVDSIINLHRHDFSGRGTLADRQNRLGSVIFKLIKIAELYQVAVVFTNQIMSNPDGQMFGNPDKPTGGNVLAHLSTYRLAIYKSSGIERVIKIIDSPHHPFSDTRFAITKAGIKDVED